MHLHLHPDTPPATVQSVEASVGEEAGAWRFRYVVGGAGSVIRRQPAVGRANDLWTTTCFEAFVRLPSGSYLEFNFSPSGQWAAYRFKERRMGRSDEPTDVEISLDEGPDLLVLDARVRCQALVAGLRLNLSAVIEELGGAKSYWALAHPAGPPDFHDPACFIASLPPIAQR